MRLLDIIQGKLVVPQMRSRTKWDAIEELVDRLVEEHEIRLFDRQEILDAVLTQERLQSTGLRDHLAVPHCRSRILEDLIGVLGLSREGIPFGSIDGSDARIVCLLVIPEAQYRQHLKTLADVARLLADPALAQELRAVAEPAAATSILALLERREGPEFLGDS